RPDAQVRRPIQSVTRSTSNIDQKEAFLVALLLRYPSLRDQGMAVAPSLLWETEAREVLEFWQESESLEVLKTNAPVELMDYFERLTIWKIPQYSEAVAADALADCVKRLNRRRLEAEQQAMTAQIAGLQEE